MHNIKSEEDPRDLAKESNQLLLFTTSHHVLGVTDACTPKEFAVSTIFLNDIGSFVPWVHFRSREYMSNPTWTHEPGHAKLIALPHNVAMCIRAPEISDFTFANQPFPTESAPPTSSMVLRRNWFVDVVAFIKAWVFLWRHSTLTVELQYISLWPLKPIWIKTTLNASDAMAFTTVHPVRHNQHIPRILY